VTLAQALFGGVLVLLLLAVGAVAGWKQVKLLHGLSATQPAEDRSHLRHRAWRRLACGVLMIVLAGLLAGALLWLEGPAQKLRELLKEASHEEVFADPEKRSFARFYGWYWVGFLFLLLLLLILAACDLWAVRRYGRKQMRRLQQDRRDMIARQTALLRQDRGHEL
jgi:hypothetical protein